MTQRGFDDWHFYSPKTGEEIKPMAEHHDVSLYRAMHHLNKGGLHRALNVPESEKIPAEKLESARHSTNSHIKHMANFAHVMGEFHHGK
jgi:hypothetical protein